MDEGEGIDMLVLSRLASECLFQELVLVVIVLAKIHKIVE